VFVPAWLLAVIALLAIGALGFGIGRWTDSSDNSSVNASTTNPVPVNPGNGNANSGNANSGNGNSGNNNGNGNTPFPTPSANSAFLGVASQADSGNGARLTVVAPNSPAANGGLQVGDVITAVDNNPVTSPAQLAARILAHSPGDQVTIHYTRNGQSATAQVTLASRSSSQSNPS
jgi:putative serine protease PepD